MISQLYAEVSAEVNAFLSAIDLPEGDLTPSAVTRITRKEPKSDYGLRWLGVDADYTDAWCDAMDALIGDREVEAVDPREWSAMAREAGRQALALAA